jgi:glyoxylase-like metal-dependent hydrolase (beta-lactamase superfamily II)
MLGLELPDVDVWSDRVVVALGQNPGPFTGPGTNSYLIGTGPERLLLDPGQGVPGYLPVLERALELASCRIQAIVLTHGHPDHIGGVPSVLERHGALEVSKRPWPGVDERHDVRLSPIDDGSVVRTEGATLRAVHTPGHAPDHLCFMLEAESALFSGDNVLGVGTTVIPLDTGDLGEYLSSLERLLEEAPERIYPAHGPVIPDGCGKLREYLAHRQERERQIVSALQSDGVESIPAVVAIVYAAYPKQLHAAAGQSVASHLVKLEREGRVQRDGSPPLEARWKLV